MSRTASRGFTLVELLVTMAIAAILANIAYPAFHGVLLKGRRSDGLSALMQLHLVQERWRSNRPTYADIAELGVPARSSMGHYRLDVDSHDAGGFVATATATGAQAVDRECRVLQLRVDRGDVRYASGEDGRATNAQPLNKRCWNQ